MKHIKYDIVKTLVDNSINVLLEGAAGTGKTTLIKNIAEDLKLDFYSIAMTRQTTMSALLGFISINGVYIPSQLRKAVEEGGLMLLDEIDGADVNTLLCLNTLENGYLAFPDGIIEVHKDFRLCATANPQDEHSMYTGRAKLDAATLDRFDIIRLDRDPKLELFLTDEITVKKIDIARQVCENMNSDIFISMRDSIRLYKRSLINLDEGYIESLLESDINVLERYTTNIGELEEQIEQSTKLQSECKSIVELWDTINSQSITGDYK